MWPVGPRFGATSVMRGYDDRDMSRRASLSIEIEDIAGEVFSTVRIGQ
jgi:hypothetical protein